MKKSSTEKRALIKELVLKGISNKEIASRLNITEKAVKDSLTTIYKTLGFKSRAELLFAELTAEKETALLKQAADYLVQIEALQSQLAGLKAAKATNKFTMSETSTTLPSKNQ